MSAYIIYMILGVVVLLLVVLLLIAARRIRRLSGVNRRFSLTMSCAYEQIYELDLATNTFYQYFILNGMLEKTRMHDPLDVYLEKAIAKNVYQSEVGKIKALLTHKHLQEMSDNNETAYVEYRRISPQGTAYWCSLLVQGLSKRATTPALVMLYICDIDEIKSKEHQARKRLTEALKNAERLSEVKSNFTSRISHEIRTPLNAIMGYLSIAKDCVNDPEHVADCVSKATIASEHLLSIVNDILDVSAMESGKMRLDKRPFKLRSFIGNLGTLYFGQAEEAELTFAIHIQDVTEDTLIGDDLRLRQILMNLINNAFKFTKPGGHVTLTVQQKAIVENTVHLAFTVEDDGIGMKESFLEHIFDAYEQEEAATAREHGGSGLGLSIVKNLTEMMGGSITVQSELGKGSTFTVNLPIGSIPYELPRGAMRQAISRLRMLAVTPDRSALETLGALAGRLGCRLDTAINSHVSLEKAESAVARGEGYDLLLIDWDMPEGQECLKQLRGLLGEQPKAVALAGMEALSLRARMDALGLWYVVQRPLNHSILLDMLTDAVSSEHGVPENHMPDLSGNHVLLVEDNRMNREIGRELLAKVGIAVDTAENGEIAVERFTSQPPNTYQLILMDVQMPVMDGFAATRAIRAFDRADAKTIPIVALTANAYPSDVNQSLAAGMNAHASKPIDPDAFYALLQKFMPEKEGA